LSVSSELPEAGALTQANNSQARSSPLESPRRPTLERSNRNVVVDRSNGSAVVLDTLLVSVSVLVSKGVLSKTS